ncbi:MAG: hypothetical protein MRY74_15165 [Neomegalonema sp.]|nr:hypothetical protein [Neomegalonema sp.]
MAAAFVSAVEIYVWIGIAIAAAFLSLGVGRIDPAARGAYAFRILVLPGVVGLWPLVLWRWVALELAQWKATKGDGA